MTNKSASRCTIAYRLSGRDLLGGPRCIPLHAEMTAKFTSVRVYENDVLSKLVILQLGQAKFSSSRLRIALSTPRFDRTGFVTRYRLWSDWCLTVCELCHYCGLLWQNCSRCLRPLQVWPHRLVTTVPFRLVLLGMTMRCSIAAHTNATSVMKLPESQ